LLREIYNLFPNRFFLFEVALRLPLFSQSRPPTVVSLKLFPKKFFPFFSFIGFLHLTHISFHPMQSPLCEGLEEKVEETT
jgi:hypothetical protein